MSKVYKVEYQSPRNLIWFFADEIVLVKVRLHKSIDTLVTFFEVNEKSEQDFNHRL